MILVRVMGNFQLVNEQVYCCKGLCFNQNHELRVAVGPEIEQVILAVRRLGVRSLASLFCMSNIRGRCKPQVAF